ncbi:DUF2514 domain-containing protein [Pseudomonas sp. BNK-6]|uniref:DUF2514 domain-containing protein n=1 Tax=unclassified Pseudomonas TaxID=196821 RepID=UPI003A879CF4
MSSWGLKVGGAAVSLALVAWAFWGVYGHGRTTMDAEWQVRWAVRDAGDQQAWALAESKARKEELRRTAAQEEVRVNAQEQEQIATVGADDADAAGQRLHDDAARYAGANKCAADTASAARGPAATRAAMVLSELLDRSVATNRELAKAYDRARIAGLACEATYSILLSGSVTASKKAAAPP